MFLLQKVLVDSWREPDSSLVSYEPKIIDKWWTRNSSEAAPHQEQVLAVGIHIKRSRGSHEGGSHHVTLPMFYGSYKGRTAANRQPLSK